MRDQEVSLMQEAAQANPEVGCPKTMNTPGSVGVEADRAGARFPR